MQANTLRAVLSRLIPLLEMVVFSACKPGGDLGQMPPGTIRSDVRNANLQVVAEQPNLVFDMKNRLVWQRCLLEQTFRAGRCQGKATEMDHEKSLHAAHRFNLEAKTAEGERQLSYQWRLPTVFEAATLLHCPDNAYFEVPKEGLFCCPTKRWDPEMRRCDISHEQWEDTWQRQDVFPDAKNPDVMTSDLNVDDLNGSGGQVFTFGPISPMGGRANYLALPHPSAWSEV